MSDHGSLSPADDLPIHQVAEPFRRVGTSDRHFYDRFYFNLHPTELDGPMVALGFANYPNLGVADGYAVALDATHHRVVRASRELTSDRTNTTVGPLHIEVQEGLSRIRVLIEPNPWGIALDATYQASFPAQLEPPHFVRRMERVITDTSRFTQTGRWEGTLTLGDRTYDLHPDGWWGGRDRSWGVRPVGDPEPPGRAQSLPFSGAMHNWAPIQFADHELLYFVMEDGTGRRSLEEAVRVWPPSAGRPPEELGRPVHELRFEPGTRLLRGGAIRFPEAPEGELAVTFETSTPLRLGLGTGYTGDDGWVHGKWQGASVVDGLVLETSSSDYAARDLGPIDALTRFEVDGQVGWGVFEYSMRGPNRRYGFE